MTQSIAQQTALTRYRAQFPALSNKTYLNFGGQGPLPQTAIDAIQTAHSEMQSLGPFSKAVNDWINAEEAATRQAIAQQVGTTAEAISLTENTTAGCNIGLWGIDWREGDHLVLSDCEHQGIIAAVETLRQRFGVKLSVCSLLGTASDDEMLDRVSQHLRPNTRMVVLSHLLWNTGQVLPLKAIVNRCHQYAADRRPIYVLVDAAQSIGVLPLELDAIGVDFYAFTGHKWWCGPAGIGGLYVNSVVRDRLQPTFVGWRGIKTSETGQPIGWQPDGRRYEVATSDYTLLPSLRAAIKLHETWGTRAERYQRIQELSAYLWQGLQTVPGIACLCPTPPPSGLVSFSLQGQEQRHRAIVSALERSNILVRQILNPNCIRACVHYFTLESELDELIAQLRLAI